MLPELREQSRPGHILRPVSTHPALHAAGKACWDKGVALWPGRYDEQREINRGFEFPAETGFGSVTFAISPATYSVGGDAHAMARTCNGHTDQNNAYKSLQPQFPNIVDLDAAKFNLPGIITGEDDPRWVEFFSTNPDGSPRTSGLGRNVMHVGPGPRSPEAGRFLPMGVVYGDPSEQWHWAEGLTTTRHVEGVPVARHFMRSRFMRVVIIPRLSGRSEAALCLRRAGGLVFGQPMKRRVYEDLVWPRTPSTGKEGRMELQLQAAAHPRS
jgi:hypothetical protein